MDLETPSVKRQRKRRGAGGSLEAIIDKYLDGPEDEDDEDYLWSRSIAKTLKKLPADKKELAKYRMQGT